MCSSDLAVTRDTWGLVASRPIPDSEVAYFGLVRFEAMKDFVVTRIRRDGPAAYVVPVSCACGQEHVVALGFGEVQPCRYQAFLVGVRAA